MLTKQVCIGAAAVVISLGLFAGSAQAIWVEDFESYPAGDLGGDWTLDFGFPNIVVEGIGWEGSKGINGPSGNHWMARTIDPIAGNAYVYTFKVNPSFANNNIGTTYGGGTGIYFDLRYHNSIPGIGAPGFLYYNNVNIVGTPVQFDAIEKWMEARSTLTPVGAGWTHLDEYRIYDSDLAQWGDWVLLGETTTAETFDMVDVDRRYVRTAMTGSQGTLDDLSFALAPPTAQPGDFDGDGDVDGADFVVWQTNFPKSEGGTLDTGDADADGDVDGADFVVWQTNFPFTPSGGVAPVPEPATFCLAIAAAGTFLLLRGKRR